MNVHLLKVNELCMELLASYPAIEFVRVTLSALSTLASATLIDIPQQVALLLRYLQDDPRLPIKCHALHLLHTLARRGAHLWPQGALDNLIGKYDEYIFSHDNKGKYPTM